MKIGVLGCGNMASAVVEGLHASGVGELNFVTYTPGRTRAVALAAKVNGRAVGALEELGRTDMAIIGCKPHQFRTLADELVGQKMPLEDVVSLMAAVPIKDIQGALNVRKVTRLMPSMPMRYGEGISLLCHDPSVEQSTRKFLAKALKYCSKVFPLGSEDLLDKLTLVASCGPAYVYYLTEAFEDVLNRWQGDRELSRELAVRLFKGASVAMEGAGGDSLEELIRGVASEKGVTGKAIESFQRDNLKKILYRGLERAWERLLEMKKGSQ